MGAGGDRAIWVTAWSVVLLFVAFLGWWVTSRSEAPTGPDMANAGNAGAAEAAGTRASGAPPDISQMSPRERFLRLHDRVMSAQGSGDSATAQRFAPMALSAYGMLDVTDIDARYHAGALFILTRAYPQALALADTIQAEAKDNLLADLLRLEVAQARKDAPAEARARKAFVANYEGQIATRRPEYEEHKAMLADLRKQLSAQ